MPVTFAQNENGLEYVATGFDPVRRWDAITGGLELAGVAAPTLTPVIAGAGDGGIFGTYFAYVRFVDRLGNYSNLSPLSNTLVLDAIFGTVTSMVNVTVGDETYTRLHSTGISTQLVNGNVVIITGTTGMTGIDGTWFYFADPNGDTDDFLLQSAQAVILCVGTYGGGGTWTGSDGTVTAADDVTFAGVPYTRLTGSAGTWTQISEGQTITVTLTGLTTDDYAYHKDVFGGTDTFYLTTIAERVAASGTYDVNSATWHKLETELTGLIEVADGSGTRYTQLTAPGIGDILASGDAIKILDVSGVTLLNGAHAYAPAVASFGNTDDFYLLDGSTKVLGVPTYPDMTTGSWTGAQTGTLGAPAITAGLRETNGPDFYTRLTAPGVWALFNNGDQITISGLTGTAPASMNGTWFFFKDIGGDNFYLSANTGGSPRLFSGTATAFTSGQKSGSSLFRSPAVGSTAVSRIDQVRDSNGDYTRIRSGFQTGTTRLRQDGDDITFSGFTGTLTELNTTFSFERDYSRDSPEFDCSLITGGSRFLATVSYADTTFAGTYAKAFGTVQSAGNFVVAGLTYTRLIANSGIQNLLSDEDDIVISGATGMTGINGTWDFFKDTDGVAPYAFYITNIPTVVIGSGSYTPPGTWSLTVTGPGTIDSVDHVTVSNVSYTRFTAEGISLVLQAGNPITLAGVSGITFNGSSVDGDWFYYPDPAGGTDTFYLQSATAGILGVGDYSGGAQWVQGYASIEYSNLARPPQRSNAVGSADGETGLGSTEFDSATAAFTLDDIGSRIIADGIPEDAYIQRINSATEVVLSAQATATATGLAWTVSRYARRQILRNANGDTTTFYLDLDTADLTGVTASSTLIDADLTAQEAVPLFDDNQVDLAVSRYGVPPDDLGLLLNFRSRLLFSGAALYDRGAVGITQNSTDVIGVGTEWTANLAGRELNVFGLKPALIAEVNVTEQRLLLAETWPGPTDPYASYLIASTSDRQRLVAWSEAGLPEAVAPSSSFQLVREGSFSDIVGMFSFGPVVYLSEPKLTHILSFGSDPAPQAAGGDGSVSLHSYRGCVNQRCVVIVEDMAYVMDQQGIHGLSRQGDVALSTGIQDLFDPGGDYPYRVRWEYREFFHGVHDMGQELIRFFVSCDARKYPHFCLTLDYRLNRWWLEEYPLPICSSVLGFIGNAGSQSAEPVVFVGSTAQRVFVLGRGSLDGINANSNDTDGTVTSAGFLSLTDSTATFPPELIGLSVSIISGTGQGQQRFIVDVEDGVKLILTDPWTALPDTTSGYQIGGINYRWKSGSFRFAQLETQNVRALELLAPTVEHGTAQLQAYLNRSETPVRWGVTARNQGINTIKGAPEAVLDLTRDDGYFKARLDGLRQDNLDGARFLEVELAGIQGADPLTFLELNIEGVTP